MKTKFAILCATCGLSQREAAQLLNVRLDTVKSWSTGRNPVPDGAIEELAKLFGMIHVQAENMIRILDEKTWGDENPPAVELNLATDDAEAASLGWPFASAQAACVGLTIGIGMRKGYKFRVVPRGSTVAGAAAADEHEKIL